MESSEFWENLPLEMVCEIMSYITDIKDIVSLPEMFAKLCIKRFTSKDFIITPISYFNSFESLVYSDNKILFEVDANSLSVIASLRRLRKANFIINSPELLVPLLHELEIRSKDFEVDFKIVIQYPTITVGIIIQGQKFIIIPRYKFPYYNDISNVLSDDIRKEYTELQEVHHRNMLLRYKIIEFLRMSDFGLVYPLQPPSNDNPPLSIYINKLADGGISRRDILIKIVYIYVYYHKLKHGPIITADDNMKDYFPLPEGVDINYSLLTDANLRRIVNGSFNRKVSIEEIAECDIPKFLPDDTINNIEAIIGQAHNVYKIYDSNKSVAVLLNTPIPIQNYYTTTGHIIDY